MHFTAPPALIGNTLIAGNRTTTGSGPDAEGTYNSAGYNLIGATNGSSGWVSSDLTGMAGSSLDPRLGPLQNNGGTTPTHALLAGGPAIDAGKSFGVTTDQRGQPRPFDITSILNASGGDGSDIGAFELVAPTLNVALTPAGAVVVSWPSPSPGFNLRVGTDLATPNWTTPPETVQDNGTSKYIIVNPPVGNRFYRLASP